MCLAYIRDSVNDSAFSFSQRTFVICPFSIFTSVYMQQIDLHSFFNKLTSVVIISFILHSSLLRPLVFIWYLTKLDCSTSTALKSFLLLSASTFLSESVRPSSTCSDSMPRGFNPMMQVSFIPLSSFKMPCTQYSHLTDSNSMNGYYTLS